MKSSQLTLFFIILCSAIIFIQDTKGQILNIERHRLQTDSAKNILMKATFGMNIYNRSAASDSPVNMFGYNGKVNSIYFTEKYAFTGIAQIDYLKINDDPFLNFGFFHLRAQLHHQSPGSLEIFNQYSYDNFRGLDSRILLGAGWRKAIISNDQSDLYLGIGALYEWEKWENPNDGKTSRVNYLKSSNYLSYRISLNNFLDLNAIVYYQLGYDRTLKLFRHRTSGNLNINSKVTKWLSISNSFEFSYDDKPITPITRFIFSFRTGVSIDL